MDISLVLLVAAAVLFGLATFAVKSPVHLGWAGACLLTLSFLF